MKMKLRNIALALLLAGSTMSVAHSQTLNIEEERAKAMKDIASAEIPDPDKIETLSKQVFAVPVDQQKDDDLKNLAKSANVYANLTENIESEYQSYLRENYQYNFVKTKAGPVSDKYIELSNKFEGIRNQAYFNLGERAKSRGDNVGAFFYYRDAFRLSSFECGKGAADKCMRRIAEIEMQKLLHIQGVQPYTTWQ